MTDIEKAIEFQTQRADAVKYYFATYADVYGDAEMSDDEAKSFYKSGNDQIKLEEIILQALQEKAEREKNLPLTLEELQGMDGQPCYLIDMEPPEYGWKNGWYLVDIETKTVYNQYKCYFFKNIIGLAYRFKKE